MIHVHLLDDEGDLLVGPQDPRSSQGTFSVDLATTDDTSHIAFGRELLANWCSDVSLPDRPRPVVSSHWPIVAGKVEMTVNGTSATATLSEIVAIRDDGGRVTVPNSIQVVNDQWGLYPG